MANFPKGFKSSIAEGMRSQKANDEDVVPVLESFRKEVEPYASLAEPTPAQECLPMSRRLTLDENVALNQQTLYRIEGILRVEQRLADSLVEALGDSGEDQSGAGSNDKLYRCAVREMLSKSTRRGLERARMLGPVPESDQAVALLEAFFEVCPDPNPAEYLFFARKFRCSEEQVIHWFSVQRGRLHALFIARAGAGGDTDIARMYRMRKVELENETPAKRLPIFRTRLSRLT